MNTDSEIKAPSPQQKTLITASVILLAILLVSWKFWDYIVNPWTRNGQVMAQVIQVTPRVSGTIIELPVKDNQFVNAGDLLFRIDPRTFQSDVDLKEGLVSKAEDEIAALKKEVEARAAAIGRYTYQIEQAKSKIVAFSATVDEKLATYRRLQSAVKSGAVSRDELDDAKAEWEFAVARVQHSRDLVHEAEADKLEAEAELARAEADLGAEGEANARLRVARAAAHHAHLDMEFTEVMAKVDGYITNLNLRLGDYATAKKANLALVDVNSYWVSGFFKESAIEHVRPGNRAVVTLMGYPSQPIEGVVESIGWGVYQKDGSTAQELLPQISATFEWIRLAQRIPVRIQLTEVPEGIDLRVGLTASVLVMTGTDVAIMEEKKPVPPVPKALH
ncbi:MAG: HlyD family secretion protein [Thiohalobacterales bacterium]